LARVPTPRPPQRPHSGGQASGDPAFGAPGINEALSAERTMRRRLYELAETQRWVHHVADLETGEVVTTPLDRPITPLSRAERLSQLGHRFDPTLFAGPAYRLTPKRPHQPSPEAWVEASQPDYYAPSGDLLWWEPPRDFDARSEFLGLIFYFAVTPDRRAVVSLSLAGRSFAGTMGYIQLQAQLVPNPVYVPIDGTFGARTVDFTFVPPQRSVEVVMALLPGVELLTFTGVSFGPEPLVLDPGDFTS
jgi:hypothetical protein